MSTIKLAVPMPAESAAALRAPFPPEKVGKLPKVTCSGCRDARSRVCDKHRKSKCTDCGAWITDAHLHLDFVGHADTTDRLLEVDPAWTWEPFALDARGLPALDDNGGMWIRLTVCGVTRIGYGDADGKRGGNAVKEAIGDSLRNAAMRFGVALDLWRKETHVEESTGPQQRSGESWEQAAKPPTPEEARNNWLANARASADGANAEQKAHILVRAQQAAEHGVITAADLGDLTRELRAEQGDGTDA